MHEAKIQNKLSKLALFTSFDNSRLHGFYVKNVIVKGIFYLPEFDVDALDAVNLLLTSQGYLL